MPTAQKATWSAAITKLSPLGRPLADGRSLLFSSTDLAGGSTMSRASAVNMPGSPALPGCERSHLANPTKA